MGVNSQPSPACCPADCQEHTWLSVPHIVLLGNPASWEKGSAKATSVWYLSRNQMDKRQPVQHVK